jgi:Na+/proline symporter
VGLLWKRGNTVGAISGGVAGFGLGIILFLDQTLGWSLPLLAHPYMKSFLHRTLVVWLFAAAVMIAASLMSDPPRQDKIEGTVFSPSHGRSMGLSDYRTWASLLFVCTVVLWWTFR